MSCSPSSLSPPVQLPHTLLSRFDLIFLILDPQDEVYDARLARHLVGLYYRGTKAADDDGQQGTARRQQQSRPTVMMDVDEVEDGEGAIDAALLKDYVSYAKVCVVFVVGRHGFVLVDRDSSASFALIRSPASVGIVASVVPLHIPTQIV